MAFKLLTKLFSAIGLLLLVSIPSANTRAADHDNKQVASNTLWQRMGHEPTYFGLAFDDRDENYIDINLSLKWSPHNDGTHPDRYSLDYDPADYRCSWRYFQSGCFFLAFTTEQAFYLGTRDSSPVIGQRFNPEMFIRFWRRGNSYIDISFNHESNGQSIDSREEFEAKQRELAENSKEGPAAAKEFLSRNWNYWELSYKSAENLRLFSRASYSYHLLGRYFINSGTEETFEFEDNNRNIERSDVDGLRFIGKHTGRCATERHCWDRKLVYIYTTGYDNPFQRDSHRIEWGINVDKWPVTLWAHIGYNEDLIDFYRNTKSGGITFEITGI